MMFEDTLVKCVVVDSLEHITNTQDQSCMRLVFVQIPVDLFIVSRYVPLVVDPVDDPTLLSFGVFTSQFHFTHQVVL